LEGGVTKEYVCQFNEYVHLIMNSNDSRHRTLLFLFLSGIFRIFDVIKILLGIGNGKLHLNFSFQAFTETSAYREHQVGQTESRITNISSQAFMV
jgi:hypothetical protein